MIDTTQFIPIRFRRVGLRTKQVERTAGRIRAAQKAVSREAAEMPLFPELRRWSNADERMTDMDRQSAAFAQRMRDRHAETWKAVRQTLRRLPLPQRVGILLYWRQCSCPAESHYLADMLHGMLFAHRPGGWQRLRELRLLYLVGAGRIDRALVFKSNTHAGRQRKRRQQ